MLGFDQERNVVNLGDTAEVFAYLRDRNDNLVPEDDLVSASFVIQKPNAIKVEANGEVTADGTGRVRFDGTDQVGQYYVIATFTNSEGMRFSSRADFEVIDPFNPPLPTPIEYLANSVYDRLRDCFDAEQEGPWLQDVTNAYFNESRMSDFVDAALFDINLQHPPTELQSEEFIIAREDGTIMLTPEYPLLVQGVLLGVIRHLIRSYTEQPLPQGAAIVHEDRRDYATRWGQVYQMEMQTYQRQVALFKRRFLGLGQSKMLIGSKAGRLLPAPMRAWSAGRGYRL